MDVSSSLLVEGPRGRHAGLTAGMTPAEYC